MEYRSKAQERDANSAITFYRDIREGFHYIGRSSSIKQLCGFYIVESLLILPMLSVLFPFLFKEIIGFSNHQFAMLETSYVAGMLVGSILMATVFAKSSAKGLIRRGLVLQVFTLLLMTLATLPVTAILVRGARWPLFAIFSVIIVLIGQ